MLTWTERATLFKILAVLWTQHRWCLVLGKTSSMAFQKPSAPSPTARSGAISSPRRLMSMRSWRRQAAGRHAGRHERRDVYPEHRLPMAVHPKRLAAAQHVA